MQSCNSPVIELFDETGELLCSIVKGDGEVWEASIVFFIPWWALGEPIPIIIIDLLLEHRDLSLESLHLLSVDIISDPDGVSEPINNASELVWGWVRGGGEDILDRGRREGESPGIDGGDCNLRPLLCEVLHLEGIVCPKAKVSWKAFSGLFRGSDVHWNGQGCRGCDGGKGLTA